MRNKTLYSVCSILQNSDFRAYIVFCLRAKGQLISKCPFGIIVWTKYQRNYFWISALNFFCCFLGASWKLFGLPGDLVCNIISREAYRKPPKASRKPPGRYKKFLGRNPEIISLVFCPNNNTKRTF